MATDLEKKAKEAFIDDHFELAVDLYSQAIDICPHNAELFADRAQANIKLNSFTEAVADANQAIKLNPSSAKAYLRKGIACMKLEEYQTAKVALQTGASLAPGDTRFSNLLKECAERIAEEEGALSQTALEKGPVIASISQKVLATGKIILLSVLVMIAINPILTTSPALATFQAATQATAGGGKGLFTSEILSSAWTGFFAGCLHTLSGPDHLAALAPLSIGRTRLESAAVGALWGCGHDAGQVIFGLLFLLLKDRLHIEVIRTWGTRVVGLTLLVIGGMGIKEASESVPTPCVALENGECDVSVYESLEKENPVAKKKKKIGFATFATGIVHGLQPDALMMVLPALALPSRVAGAAFLSMFLAGTVVAMGGYTVFIGSCSEALKERVPRITEKLTWASSLVAIGLGFAILVSQFFGFSLY